MSDPRPAWSRESILLRLPEAARIENFSPEWAFEGSTGAGVRVAVIDSGIEADHERLGGSVDQDSAVEFGVETDGTIIRRDGPHDDVYGHGTACAGIIHALAPEAAITSIRVLDEGLRGKAAAFHAGLSWAVDHEYDVINLSLGAAKRDWALAFHETCDRGYFNNSFIVTAANNINRDSFPSLFASVTSVASNTSKDPLRFHFNPEPPTEFLARGIDVDVPWLGGTSIVTTGNSFAAPHVAGLAALIKAKHPDLRPFQIKTALWAASANVREATRPERPRRTTASSGASSSRSGPVNQVPYRAQDVPSPVLPLPPTHSHGVSTTARERAEIQALMDDYEVDQLLARGPWGPVFSATKDGQLLALRRLDPALAADEPTRARFAASVRIASELRHPHVLPILELREHEYFAVIAMPLCPANLARDRMPGPLPPAGAIAAAVSLLRGLHQAHAAGIYHGDLRPHNALVDSDRRVVLSDVGIAAALSSDIADNYAPDDPLSWTYQAPEQLEGGAIGAFTDVHAVGLILFELLSGGLPYQRADTRPALLQNRAPDRLRSLGSLVRRVPEGLVAIADRAVAPDPARRYPSAAAMERDLVAAAERELGPDWLRDQPYDLVEQTPPEALQA